MPGGRPARGAKTRPDAPDLGPLSPAPARLEDGAAWDGVQAGSVTVVPDRVRGVELSEVRWEQADLIGKDLSGLQARDVSFVRCNLAGAILDGATLSRVSFDQCQMMGTVLSGARLTDVTIRASPARRANFRMTRARFLLVEDSSLAEASLYQAELAVARLFDCDLTGADFTGAHFSGVELHGSTLERVKGARALDGGVTVDRSQLLALGMALLAESGVRVADERT